MLFWHYHLGMTLDEFIIAHAMSEQTVAAALGVSQSSVNRYRNKSRIPRESVLLKIARFTHGAVTPNDFFQLEDAK